MNGERLSVATLNVWGRYGDWPARRDVLRTRFAESDFDLIALQESVVVDGYDQVTDILRDGYHVVHQGRRAADGRGCSIASRWPVEEAAEIDLLVTERVDPDDFLGRTTAARIGTPLGPVLFVNHKPCWQLGYERERELQAVRAARAIERLVAGRDIHVVLAGDFDARPESAGVRFWTGRQSLDDLSVHYQDAWEAAGPAEPGYTFTSENPLVTAEEDWARIPPRRIDYLMVRCDDRGPTLRVQSCRRFADTPDDGVFGSDHFGVAAVLGR